MDYNPKKDVWRSEAIGGHSAFDGLQSQKRCVEIEIQRGYMDYVFEAIKVR